MRSNTYLIISEVFQNHVPFSSNLEFLKLINQKVIIFNQTNSVNLQVVIRVCDEQLYLTLCSLVEQNNFDNILIFYTGDNFQCSQTSYFELTKKVYKLLNINLIINPLKNF